MNPATFNNDADTAADENYFAFVEWISRRTADELREAKGVPERQRLALRRYYKTGERANLTHGELIDILAVSTPSIAEQAGYDNAEIDALMGISDHLTSREIETAEIIE